jgi:hypothetical protein
MFKRTRACALTMLRLVAAFIGGGSYFYVHRVASVLHLMQSVGSSALYTVKRDLQLNFLKKQPDSFDKV